MADGYKPEFYGLPVATNEEAEGLRIQLDPTIKSAELMDDIVQKVILIRPAIKRVIEHDKLVYVQSEHEKSLEDYEVFQYTEGIEEGYRFAVGCFTYICMLRGNHKTVNEYLKNKEVAQLPVSSSEEQDRVQLVRIGDIATDPVIESDHLLQIAHEDAAELLFQSPHLDEIVSEEIARIHELSDQEDTEREIYLYTEGFRHGIANAVGMYVQSYIQRTLNKYEPEVSDSEV